MKYEIGFKLIKRLCNPNDYECQETSDWRGIKCCAKNCPLLKGKKRVKLEEN